MSLLLRDPELAGRSCSDCQTWHYKPDGTIATRGGKQLKRQGPTPCKTCPKESPEKAHESELSPKNQKAVEFYYTTRAMNGANLTEEQKRDAIVQRNQGLIDQIVRPHEAQQSMVALMPMLALSRSTGDK